jgi:hypothetical protein
MSHSLKDGVYFLSQNICELRVLNEKLQKLLQTDDFLSYKYSHMHQEVFYFKQLLDRLVDEFNFTLQSLAESAYNSVENMYNPASFDKFLKDNKIQLT